LLYRVKGIRAALGESGRDQRYADKQNPLNDGLNLHVTTTESACKYVSAACPRRYDQG